MENNVIYRKKVNNFWFKVNELNDNALLLSFRNLNLKTRTNYTPLKIIFTRDTFEIDKMVNEFLEN